MIKQEEDIMWTMRLITRIEAPVLILMHNLFLEKIIHGNAELID